MTSVKNMCQAHLPQKGYSKPDSAYKPNNVCTAIRRLQQSKKTAKPLKRENAQDNSYTNSIAIEKYYVNPNRSTNSVF